MKCGDDIISLKELSDKEIIFQLKMERNNLAKSRQQWIQAAFNSVYYDDAVLFYELVDRELCEKCEKFYQYRQCN